MLFMLTAIVFVSASLAFAGAFAAKKKGSASNITTTARNL